MNKIIWLLKITFHINQWVKDNFLKRIHSRSNILLRKWLISITKTITIYISRSNNTEHKPIIAQLNSIDWNFRTCLTKWTQYKDILAASKGKISRILWDLEISQFLTISLSLFKKILNIKIPNFFWSINLYSEKSQSQDSKCLIRFRSSMSVSRII